MYVVTSAPFVNLTRATLRSAEFGFLGVVVYTRVHTPRFCGHSRMAGDFVFHRLRSRPSRMSWLIVGIVVLGAECERPAGGSGARSLWIEDPLSSDFRRC